mgnify:FL=1
MKCRYTFKIRGYIKVAELRPIEVHGWSFEFHQEGGLLSQLSVTVPANRPEDIPMITPNPSPEIKAHINRPAPLFLFVKREVRAIESLLSVFGVHQIDLNRFKTKWIPESEEEKASIHINDFSTDVAKADTESMLPMSFDLLARCVIAADEATDVEVQLAFFRKGIVDCYEERFIEAIYDFYFFLESMFGEGQFKKHGVKEAFKKSKPLREAIEKVMANPAANATHRRSELESFLKKYNGMSVEKIIEHIVELRGFLHHHTAKRTDTWHPEDHKRYGSEALLLRSIACCIAIDTSLAYLYRQHVMEAYVRTFVTDS